MQVFVHKNEKLVRFFCNFCLFRYIRRQNRWNLGGTGGDVCWDICGTFAAIKSPSDGTANEGVGCRNTIPTQWTNDKDNGER